MSTSPNPEQVLTVQMIRDAMEIIKRSPAPPQAIACHPYDSCAHVMLGGRWFAFKLLLQNWRHRSDEQIMDGLYWIVKGFPW